MSEATTRGIHVHVRAQYVPERSSPASRSYFFAYTVRITNNGTQTAQLSSRQWIITDGMDNVQNVRGQGVVGQQPVLRPGQSFEYTSMCTLPTPRGTMRGSYQMVYDSGEGFEVEIAQFQLAVPHSLN